MPTRKMRNRRGFTLLELMLVMAILVIMAGMVGFAIMNIQKNANRDLALSQINTLRGAVNQFRLNNRRFPNTLDDLVVCPQGVSPNVWRGPYLDTNVGGTAQVPVDPWGNPYELRIEMGPNNQEIVRVISAGADGIMGTEDDVPDAQGR